MNNGEAGYRDFLNGDKEGLSDVLNEYREGLILWLAGFCGSVDTAEDILIEVLVKLIVKKPVFRGGSSFKTWLYTISGNVAKNYMRDHKMPATLPIESAEKAAISDEDMLKSHFRAENAVIVHKGLYRINPEYARVLYLSYFEDFSNGEIAKIMHKTNRQVENLLYRAKKSLRAELEKEGFMYEE